MLTVNNGSVAVTLEWQTAIARAIDHVPAQERPPYCAVCHVTRLSDTIAKISGLVGSLSRGHMWLLAQLLREQGFKVLYAERTDAHIVPMAEHIDAGDWAGHWRLDLEQMRDRRRNTRGAACA